MAAVGPLLAALQRFPRDAPLARRVARLFVALALHPDHRLAIGGAAPQVLDVLAANPDDARLARLCAAFVANAAAHPGNWRLAREALPLLRAALAAHPDDGPLARDAVGCIASLFQGRAVEEVFARPGGLAGLPDLARTVCLAAQRFPGDEALATHLAGFFANVGEAAWAAADRGGPGRPGRPIYRALFTGEGGLSPAGLAAALGAPAHGHGAIFAGGAAVRFEVGGGAGPGPAPAEVRAEGAGHPRRAKRRRAAHAPEGAPPVPDGAPPAPEGAPPAPSGAPPAPEGGPPAPSGAPAPAPEGGPPVPSGVPAPAP
jgi:hypothetical protein